ncbi:LexA family transcriptional regulator [Empedobacter brevis]|uniref:LexA family transcriptional regulator n=1 Tax=Empedobacter brevis TaxID=247 RepID=UPI00289EE073|nr:S24 family peptidase [Empedobacter brevis]
MSKELDKRFILNTIKDLYNFGSDTEFARFLGIKPQTLSSWYSRNTFDIELLYAKCVLVSGEFLLTGDINLLKRNVQNLLQNESVTNSVTFLEETKSTNNVTLSNESKENYFHAPKVVTVDKQGRDNVVLVPNKAAAGYLAGYGDTTFIKSLPTYNLPNINNGTFRMFQVAGDSMEPTIQNQSYVVGEWKENWNEDIKDGRVYIFVIQSFEYEGILVKRALNRIDKYGNVLLKSDNRIYTTKTFTPEEIKEVWEVKLYLSFNIPDPATIYDRMNDLEARLIELEQPKKRKN